MAKDQRFHEKTTASLFFQVAVRRSSLEGHFYFGSGFMKKVMINHDGHTSRDEDGASFMEKQKTRVDLIGGEGNAFFIIGTVGKALLKKGVERKAKEYIEKATDGDGDNLLKVVMNDVDADINATKQGRVAAEEITHFDTTGAAIQDLATAGYAFALAIKRNWQPYSYLAIDICRCN